MNDRPKYTIASLIVDVDIFHCYKNPGRITFDTLYIETSDKIRRLQRKEICLPRLQLRGWSAVTVQR